MLLLSEGQAGEIFKNIYKGMHINALYWHSALCVGVKKVVHVVTTGIRMLITCFSLLLVSLPLLHIDNIACNLRVV